MRAPSRVTLVRQERAELLDLVPDFARECERIAAGLRIGAVEEVTLSTLNGQPICTRRFRGTLDRFTLETLPAPPSLDSSVLERIARAGGVQ